MDFSSLFSFFSNSDLYFIKLKVGQWGEGVFWGEISVDRKDF
ncbi:Uncharacterized protein dnm_080490 [Desulfonema magnum]|uniref:Uncharacterized protein n=1 Tax=Desulfonema magnum TaxID=45655 RepID=A0A975GSE2_9BACT|nr:Uncharacterized protein dnm_080490 [Desulfonema magnum]